ncbi:inner membrane yebS domain protein, partial [Escherichia coli 97.0007]
MKSSTPVVTRLLLMPFAWGEPLLHIWLLGIRIDA